MGQKVNPGSLRLGINKTWISRWYGEKDYAKAHMWLNIAAATHSTDTLRNQSARPRDRLAKRMTPDQLAEAQRLAREWLERHQTGSQK